MTVVAIDGGFVANHVEHWYGLQVMQRIAVPMIGGMISSTLLTLIVIPATDCLELNLASLAGGAVTRTGSGSKCMMRREPVPDAELLGAAAGGTGKPMPETPEVYNRRDEWHQLVDILCDPT